jgi:hypothetical protein
VEAPGRMSRSLPPKSGSAGNRVRSFNTLVSNPVTGHDSQPVLVHILTTYFRKINFNIILPSPSLSLKWSLSKKFSVTDHACISCLPYNNYMSNQS